MSGLASATGHELTRSTLGPGLVQGRLWELQLDPQGFVVPSPQSALKHFVFSPSLQILSKY